MSKIAARLFFALTMTCTATPVSLFVATPTFAESMAQRAYDACVDAFNNKYRTLKKPKAMVSGVSGGRTHCFWNFGGSSVSSNIRNATAACEAKMERCFLFHDSSAGDPSWVARIDSMGGDDGSGGNDEAANAALMDMLSGAITTMGILNGAGGSGGSGGGGYSSGGDGGGGSGGSVCTPAQIARGWSEERCARN